MKAKNLALLLGMIQVVLGTTTERKDSNVYEPKRDDELEVGGQNYRIIQAEKGFELKPYDKTTPTN
jgi:hypothetical protein